MNSFVIDTNNVEGPAPIVQTESDDIASITISIEDGETNIQYSCKTKNEEEMALNFGVLLNDICSGKFLQDIFEILKEFGEQNPDSAEFIASIFYSWQVASKLDAEEILSTSEPAVRALQTFGASRFFKA
jgi:hypothetical protein